MIPLVKNKTIASFAFGLIAILSAFFVSAETTGSGDTVPAHEQASCRQCHFATSGVQAKVEKSICLSCHQAQRASNRGLPDPAGNSHGDQGQDCLECHSFHTPRLITTALGELDLGARDQLAPGHCESCHAVGADRTQLNPAHLQAATLYHVQNKALVGKSASTGCLNCHDRNAESIWQQATEETPLTFYTHASHPYGKLVIPGSGKAGNRMRQEIDPRIPLFDQKMECQSCHSLTAGTKDLLLPFAGPKQLCLGCHQMENDQQIARRKQSARRPTAVAAFK